MFAFTRFGGFVRFDGLRFRRRFLRGSVTIVAIVARFKDVGDFQHVVHVVGRRASGC